MLILDIDGKNIQQYQDCERNLVSVIADKIGNYLPKLKILLVTPMSTTNEIQQAAEKFQVDAVLIEMTSHACTPDWRASNNQLTVPVYQLSSNMEYFYTENETVIFFPFWLFATQTFPKNKIIIGSESDINRQYPIASTCRNLKHRQHRRHFYGKLLQKHYANNILKGFYKYDDFDFNQEEYSAELTHNEWSYFKQIYDEAPQFVDSEQDAVVDTNFKNYTQGYVHLLCETYVEYNFLSEKSYKPLMAGQMPMVFGCPDIMRMFQDLGFDLFFDIIDHAYYDSVPDWKTRISKMLNIVEQVDQLPLNKIFADTVARRQKNLELLYSNTIESSVIARLINKLSK